MSHRLPNSTTLLAALITTLTSTMSYGDTITTKAQDQKNLSITIYNHDRALVKDIRRIELPTKTVDLAWRDVSAQIQPQTAQLTSLTDTKALSLLEQNYDYDLLTPHSLLNKYIGETVRVIKTNPATGQESQETATVLSTNEGIVLKFADRIETSINGRMIYPSIPSDLKDSPTLSIKLHNQSTKPQDVSLTYLTKGLAWRADYVAQLSNDEQFLDLNGWVTLTNHSGITYNNVQIQLVAGDVNEVQEYQPARHRNDLAAVASLVEEKTPAPKEERLFEYHLYTFANRTNIANQQSKQIALLNANQIPVKKIIRILGDQQAGFDETLGIKLAANALVQFKNEGAIEQALPKGIVRVYKKDSVGSAQFIGEDRIEHTPIKQQVNLHLGQAFDITSYKKENDTKSYNLPQNKQVNHYIEKTYQVTFENAKNQVQTIEYVENIYGEWRILNENNKHQKLSASSAMWQLQVPANGKITLSYRVQQKD